MAQVRLTFYDMINKLFLVYMKFLRKHKNIQCSLTFVDEIGTNFICAEIRINSAQKMAEQPASEFAASVAVIGCQPRSCCRSVGTKETGTPQSHNTNKNLLF